LIGILSEFGPVFGYDNAPNLDEGRPVSFETKSGSGYELITFKRTVPNRA